MSDQFDKSLKQKDAKTALLHLSRFDILMVAVGIFASLNTMVALSQAVPIIGQGTNIGNFPDSLNKSEPIQGFFLDSSARFATIGWSFIVGALIWRGRMKSTWRNQGFERDIFKLFTMRGAPTRVAILKSLSLPKDRLQLAKELGSDWNVADRHIRLLLNHGLVQEDRAYGRVKLYRLTRSGERLITLLENSGTIVL